jgi:hypothetical protein
MLLRIHSRNNGSAAAADEYSRAAHSMAEDGRMQVVPIASQGRLSARWRWCSPKRGQR